MGEKGGNRLVPGPDYTVDALKLPNQAPGGSGESLQNPTKYAVEPSWPSVLVWPRFELLHRTLTMIVFAQYCSM
ncbi:hypothetical protein TNCV_4241821 [Trichonephila clavipes]|nr:hypothetical protein TNCV_4241821 [Trichonephila clavipes]